MSQAAQVVSEIVACLDPVNELEREHIEDTLTWIAGTSDIFRRVKPATPSRHLVSYVVVVEPHDGDIFLVDHIKAGLWLPTGGHVEPGEHPINTARRELAEELGISADFELAGDGPLFLTVTPTVGNEDRHTDVSLWYAVQAPRDTDFRLDPTEFSSGRWWSQAEVSEANPNMFDPHFLRFARKLRDALSGQRADTPRENRMS